MSSYNRRGDHWTGTVKNRVACARLLLLLCRYNVGLVCSGSDSLRVARRQKVPPLTKGPTKVWPRPRLIIIIMVMRYIYNALNDALSASRIHSKLKTILSKHIHKQNTGLVYLQSYLYMIIKHTRRVT